WIIPASRERTVSPGCVRPDRVSVVQPKRIEHIFWAATQLTSLEERDAYFARACAEDAEMRQRVELLLQARAMAGSFLENPAPHLTATTLPFDEERLREVGFDEVRRIIREEEPTRPSARISTLGQAAPWSLRIAAAVRAGWASWCAAI